MSITKFSNRLEELGLVTKLDKSKLSVSLEEDGLYFDVKIEDDLLKSINGFYRARQYSFDEPRRILTANKFAEVQVTKLDNSFVFHPRYTFNCPGGDEVFLSDASYEFHLSFFESERYEEVFHIIRNRIERRTERHLERNTKRKPMAIRGHSFFLNIYTAKFTPKRKSKDFNIVDTGIEKIKSCLFNLSYSHHENWEIKDEIKSRGFSYPRLHDDEVELEIPHAKYDSSLVSYYKIAKSSSFPSQCFLSYYHILEYHFLRVADEQLFNAVKTKLNDPAFTANYENVSKLLATIKRNDSIGDEKEMLKSVLRKYVVEEEFIEFVLGIQKEAGEAIYTGGKQKILGEEYNVKLDTGHALSNFSNILKHIRNSLVHSSDRYTREDTFLPLTESEDIIIKYIPIHCCPIVYK